MPDAREIKRGTDSRKNWTEINALISEVARLRNLVARHEAAIRDLRRPEIDGAGGADSLSVWRP